MRFQYIFIIIIAVALITPIGLYFYMRDAPDATNIGQKIVKAANDAYTSNSVVELDAKLPSGVRDVYLNYDILVIEYETAEGKIQENVTSDVPLKLVYNKESNKIRIEKKPDNEYTIICIGNCDCQDIEICGNGQDDDCDEHVDDCDSDCSPDSDGDGFTLKCGDCDDDPRGCGASCGPEGSETCDGYDNNCNGEIDENMEFDDCKPACEAHGHKWTGNRGQWACCGDDELEGPFQFTEISCDGRDNDCDGAADNNLEQPEANQQGLCSGNQKICEEGAWISDPDNHQIANEICRDGKDNDCDGAVDEGCSSGGGGGGGGGSSSSSTETYYYDGDADGYGNNSNTRDAASRPSGFTSVTGDCDDNNADINPGAGETCDSIDNDCDGSIDEGGVCPSACSVYGNQGACDADSACDWCAQCISNQYSGGADRCVETGLCSRTCTIGQCSATCTDTCSPTDCDSQDGCYSGTYRDYSDIANTCTGCICTQNSCADYTTSVTDADGDGYDTECDNDCDDNSASCGNDCYPGNAEICDGYDNNCNSQTDEGVCGGGTLTELTSVYPTIIAEESCAKDNGNAIYCFGGIDTATTDIPETDRIVRLNTATSVISTMAAALPEQLTKMSCEEYPNNRIYCMGGSWQSSTCIEYNGSDCIGVTINEQFSDNILQYDVASGVLNTRSTTLPVAIKAMSCEYANNNIYCLGGMADGEIATNQIIGYNPLSNNVAIMSAALPQPMAYMSCSAYNDLIYCFGGFTPSGSVSSTFVYNPVQQTVTQLNAEFPVPINKLACETLGGGIYCFGGYTTNSLMYGTSYLPQVYYYDPAGDTLSLVNSDLVQGRSSHSCQEQGGSIYCMGGTRSVVFSDEIFRLTP